MAMTSLSIILTVFVLQLHHVGPHQKGVPGWLKFLMFRVIARTICMRHVVKQAAFNEETRIGEEMCLTTFADDNKDPYNSCNGRFSPTSMFSTHRDYSTVSAAPKEHTGVHYDKISRHLKVLVAKQNYEDNYQTIVNEWQLVAHIMDRFLFCIFLITAFTSSIVILVIKPLFKPAN